MPYAQTDELTGLTSSDHSNADLLIKLASNSVDSYLRRPLTERQYSEVLPASGERALWVVSAGWPLEVVEAIEDDTTLTEGEHFRVRPDGSLWRTSPWRHEVEVTYKTGFKDDSAEMLTAKRITLELASRAAGNPQLLDSLTIDGASPSFMTREGQSMLTQFALSSLQKQELDPLRWRRRLA